MNLCNIKTTRLRIERTFQAPAEEVFDAWLDPDCKGSPWNGVTRAILQPVVDGLFYRAHPSDQGDFDLAHYGRFIVVDRPTRLQHTWVSQHTRGLESVVTLTLQAHGASTALVLVHENLPDDEHGRVHERGWQYHLAKFDDALANRAARIPGQRQAPAINPHRRTP